MLQGWGLRISHHFSGGVYWKVLLKIFSRAVTTKEILDGPRTGRKKQEKAKTMWPVKERPRLGFRRAP